MLCNAKANLFQGLRLKRTELIYYTHYTMLFWKLNQNIIIIIAYISVISSRAKYRLVSKSITRLRFDSFNTTII